MTRRPRVPTHVRGTADSPVAPSGPRSLGDRLLHARTVAGMSQTALAVAIRVDRTTISRYEMGKQVPPRGRVVQIAEATNVPLAFFTGGGSDA